MSDAKSEDKFSNKMMNNKIHSHEFDPDCPDLPYLTDNSDSESEMDVKEQRASSQPKKFPRNNISQSKLQSTKEQTSVVQSHFQPMNTKTRGGKCDCRKIY